jgi:uncharacterized RDD family membrane protein YckC
MKRTANAIVIGLLMLCTSWVWADSSLLPVSETDNLQWIVRPVAPILTSTDVAQVPSNPQPTSPMSYQVLLRQVDRDEPDTWHQVASLKGSIQPASLAAVDQDMYIVFGENRVYRLHRQAAPQGSMLTDFVKMHVQLNLPDAGKVQSAAANAQGYWLIFEPSLTVEQLSKQKQTPQDSRVLMHLLDDKWETLPLPEAVLELQQLQLITLGKEQQIGFVGLHQNQLVQVKRIADQWQSQTLPLQLKHGEQLHWMKVNNQTIVTASSQSDKQVIITPHLLADDQIFELGQFEQPLDSVKRWALLAMGQRVGLITEHPDDQLTLRTMDLQGVQLEEPLNIAITDPTDVLNQPGRLIVSMALMAAVLVMFSIWRRDPANAKITLPKGYQIASVSRRFMALAIDLAPCGLLSSWLNGISIQQLIDQWPGVAITWEQLLPGLLTICLFTLHTTITEVFTAQTLGKKLMGISVYTMAGQAPDLWQILLRNLLKILDLIAWYVLPMLVIVSAYRQRLGDVVARTIVVQPQTRDAVDD